MIFEGIMLYSLYTPYSIYCRMAVYEYVDSLGPQNRTPHLSLETCLISIPHPFKEPYNTLSRNPTYRNIQKALLEGSRLGYDAGGPSAAGDIPGEFALPGLGLRAGHGSLLDQRGLVPRDSRPALIFEVASGAC